MKDQRKHVNIAFEIARKYDADIAMLTDDAGDPRLRTTEYLAKSAIKNGWIGRVTACHARATGLYTESHHRKLAALLKKAGEHDRDVPRHSKGGAGRGKGR